MRGYFVLAAALAALLLLPPLPALPEKAPAEPTTSTEESRPTTATAGTTATTGTTAPAAPTDTADFRILSGDRVIALDEREFLIRTVASEMPASYHTEALKAQAVAAYTYYSRRRDAARRSPDSALKGADFAAAIADFPDGYTAEKLKERWGTQYDTYYKKIAAAVDAVRGKAVTYQGETVDSCWFAISTGATESAAVVWGKEVPYLQPVASPGDRLSPNYETVVTVPDAEVKAKLTAAGITLGEDPAAWFGEATRSASDTVTAIPVGGQTLTGKKLRELFSLRSAAFTVVHTDGGFRFTVHGYGHGVGMSQYGADYLARQGYSYEEILGYYYTGTKVEAAPGN